MKKVLFEKINMIAALIAVVIMTSCATSNKLDYASAYKFGHYNYNKVAENQHFMSNKWVEFRSIHEFDDHKIEQRHI